MSNHGLPLMGDTKYNPNCDKGQVALYSYLLEFNHPISNKEMRFIHLPIHNEFGNFKTDQDYNSSKCVDLSFSKNVFIHNNIPYKAITIEALYNCKKGRGVKHQFDCSILNDYIDFLLEHQIDLERVSIRCFDTIENPVILKQMQEMIKNEQSSCRRLVPTQK